MATLSDIAQQAGVSPITASRVLRGMGRVNPQTREKVVQAAERLGYRKLDKGRLVSSVKLASDMHLRVMVGSNSFKKDPVGTHVQTSELHLPLISALKEQLELTGGRLFTISLESLDQIEASIKRDKPDGLVLRQPIPTDWLNHLRGVLPIVYAVSYDHQSGVDSIYTNEHRSAAMIYKKLTELGHRDIAWFGIVDRNTAFHEWSEMYYSQSLIDRLCCSIHSVRYAAWANLAYCQVNSNKQPMLLAERDWRVQSLEDVVSDAVAHFLQLRPQPTVIVTPADEIALTVIDVLRARGLRVPEDMSVISYGGPITHESERSQLASIVLPMSDIGRAVPELILRRMADPNALPVSMQLETQLFEGASLGPMCR